jgi:hypothetical protein
MKDVKILETYLEDVKFAIFTYTGLEDPVEPLNIAISLYTLGEEYHEFIDMNMNNPWVRIVTSKKLDDIKGMTEPELKQCIRNNRIDHILD